MSGLELREDWGAIEPTVEEKAACVRVLARHGALDLADMLGLS